jgi:hypothetical protein
MIELFNSQNIDRCETIFEPLKDRLIRSLRSPWLDRMLHKLARCPNGSLGVMSTNADYTYQFPGDMYDVMEYIIQLDDGTYDFSDNYDCDVFNQLAQARLHDRQGGVEMKNRASGGCPVRHATYKKIGEHAAAAFTTEGIDPALLNDPSRVSAISQCREFVADRVERIFDELVPAA